MKQGSASRSGPGNRKVEPRAHAISPRGVSQIGQAMGNKATDHGKLLHSIEDVNAGRGYEAPRNTVATHKGGSQGRH